MSTCHNKPEKHEHTPSGYSMFTHCSFDTTKNQLDCYRGKDSCNKNNKLQKNEIIPLTYEKKIL